MQRPLAQRGFTLIELIVVISIIGILMALLFPAVGAALDTAKKTQAKNDAVQIATAVIAYETEYGRLPGTNATAQDLNGDVLLALMGTQTNLNPRRIVFIELQNYKKGKGGVSNNALLDPWGNIFKIAFDGDYDNTLNLSSVPKLSGPIGNDTNITIRKKVAVWNVNTNNSRYNVRSWE
jgi:prepilin-type N-terminal cleavage/methylation domain-containing protein